MHTQEYTTLNNGITMPLLGLGVYAMNGKEVEAAIGLALETGYRLIDTATMYNNEIEVGNAVSASNIPRNEIFITTKVNNTDQGYDQALRAFDKSMEKLAVDYIDLYLVHWPIRGSRKDTWKALEYLYQQKRVRAIGVANYLLPFLQELDGYAEFVPAVDQVEFSPFLFMQDLLDYCNQKKIQLQSYTPLTKGKKLNDPRLLLLAKKYGKTPAQIILRWNIQLGVSAIPKSSNAERLKENFDIFDFKISEEDMEMINQFNEDFRLVGNPLSML